MRNIGTLSTLLQKTLSNLFYHYDIYGTPNHDSKENHSCSVYSKQFDMLKHEREQQHQNNKQLSCITHFDLNPINMSALFTRKHLEYVLIITDYSPFRRLTKYNYRSLSTLLVSLT